MFPHVLGCSCHLQQDRDTGKCSPYSPLFPQLLWNGSRKSPVHSVLRSQGCVSSLLLLCSGIACCVERPMSTKLGVEAGSEVFSLGSEHRPWLHSVTVWICQSLLWTVQAPP